MDKGLAWACVASFLGLGTMGAIALAVEPPLVAFDELPERIGATVRVEGILARIEQRDGGWTRIALTAANASLDLVVDAPVNLSTGDRVQATGQLGAFGGRLRLQVDSAADIVLLRAWQQDHVGLERLLQRPWDFLGTHVRTSGFVDDRGLWTADGTRVPLRRVARGVDGPQIVEALVGYDRANAQFFLDVLAVEPLQDP